MKLLLIIPISNSNIIYNFIRRIYFYSKFIYSLNYHFLFLSKLICVKLFFLIFND